MINADNITMFFNLDYFDSTCFKAEITSKLEK